MSLSVTFLSDSMWRRLQSTFDDISYSEYDSVHFVPGCEIAKMSELAEKYCTESQLIVVNAGINNLLNGCSVTHCMREYDRCYRAVMSHCKTAHLAFASVSYVADNTYSKTDDSAEMNVLIADLNSQLKSYCEEHDRAHFIDLRACLSDGDLVSSTARRNLALDGLHLSRSGIKHVACALVTKVRALKSTVVNVTEVPVSSGFVFNDDAFPKLPAPEIRSRIHPASYPGQQYVTVYVANGTGIVNPSCVKPVKHDAGNVCKSSFVTRKCAVKQYVHASDKRSSCSPSQSAKQACSRVVRNKVSDVRNVSFVHNRFSVLCTDDYDYDSENEQSDVHSESVVYRSVTSTKKRKCCGKYRTSVPYKNADCVNVTKNTMTVQSPLFTNPYRVSDFGSVTCTKTCFIRKSVNDVTYCDKDVRRTFFVFDTVPRFLYCLQLSVSDPLVYILLNKYGIRLSTANTANTETMTEFRNTDNLIDCMLKVLLSNTRPSNVTFMRVIDKTGKYLVKYSNLYGKHFPSVIDNTRLHDISVNNFDIDLLLLCGDVELNPGPRSLDHKRYIQARNCAMERDTDHDNTSDSRTVSVSVVCRTANSIEDILGNKYTIVKMASSGFCGFHALAYCLTGNQSRFNDVINDSIAVFRNIPDLYRLRTNFGSLRDSSLSVDDYAAFMHDAVQRVQSGLSASNLAWCEDGHIASIALLYDLVICSYSQQNKEWHVFNETGARGYICLLSTPGHFDVLYGNNCAPIIPAIANTHGISRQNYDTSDDAWQCLQREYSLANVYNMPEPFAGIVILNSPVVLFESRDMDADTTKQTKADEKQKTPVVSCNIMGCSYTSTSAASVKMHKARVHHKKIMQNFSCDYFDCSYSCTRKIMLNMHKIKLHKTKKSATKKSTDQIILPNVHYDNKNCRHESAMESATIIKISNSAENINESVMTDVEPDDISVKSFESYCSRKSDRIAKRQKLSAGDSEHGFCSAPKRGKYACDVMGCGSVHNTARGLSMHKLQRHCKPDQAIDIMSVHSLQCDNVSVMSAYSSSSSVRRSARIRNRNELLTTAKTKSKATASHAHTALIKDQTNKSSTPVVSDEIRRLEAAQSRKAYFKSSFCEKMKQMEKQIIPRHKPMPQTDALYDKLKAYHDLLIMSLSNTTTEKLSSEVIDVISNPVVIDDSDRRFRWSTDDERRLNELNKTCKLLQPRTEWTWAAADDTDQGQYNDKRMQLCITEECKWRLVDCENCGSTGLLVGEQIDSDVCYDCINLKRANEKERAKKQEAWNKVKPIQKEYPKTADGKDLPYLQPGDKAVIAPVHPVVTIKKNHYADKRLRLESISLIQDPVPTWCNVLPRTSLADRYMIIERRVQNTDKYIVANADRVRQWLRYLFLHHKEFIRLRRQNQLSIDDDAIDQLGPNLELAEVDSSLAEHSASDARQIEADIERNDDGLTDATVTSGLAETHVFSFDRYPELYLKSKDVLRIRKEGKLEIVKDNTVRKQTYCSSANLAFPSLYAHGEMSPLDFGDYKLARYLLKKQSLFAHAMSDGKLQWTFAEDDIHMAHQYSRLSEQTVRATVGYYISSHPSVAHVPLDNILTAFRDGVDQDSGLLDSHLPDLTTIMTQLPNSRQKWFAERLGIETISRDIGSPNVFMTINLDPRASPDVRRLLYKLEYGKDMNREEPFVKDTAQFTKLLNKFAPFVAIYLYRKVKAITRVFFTKICGIQEKEMKSNWKEQDITETSWYWGRVEFTETRGCPHFHFVVKLPGVLDTGILGRIIHNGRVVRQELKCGNIKTEKLEQAWHMIEMGLLASRYAALFAHSISTASFYNENVDIDGHDDSKVISLEDNRKQFAENYRKGDITLNTHPIMRRFDDPECRSSISEEMAEIASVSCLHQCIRASCGGDPLTGDGCRFDFPKQTLKHTVAAVMQVNANQMEARVLSRRTCNRVANLNRYLIRYLRSNHDVSVLIDSAHSLRYVTKYCSKAGKHAHLLDEMIEHLNKRSTDLLPPNMKQVLSHLLLADCSHRAFISKQELAYKVMNLPDVMKSFANVDVVGFYRRANLQVPYDDEYTIEYSDRTEYSAYAERCRDDTELGRGLTKESVYNMCLNEFAESIQHTWINSKKADSKVIDNANKRKFRSRDVNTGHWRLTLCSRRKHTRPSTVLYTAPAIDYELVQHGKTTTQTTFYDLSIDKRHQLYRAYYELVMYVSWKNSPDETFLSAAVCEMLNDRDRHTEIDSRHSLQRLEEFFKVYKQFYDDGRVAPPGSSWQRDNQFAYSIYLVNQHNRDVHLDRVDNKGVLKAQYEDVDELVNVDVDIRPAVNDESDLSEYPTFENFMPPDTFRDIMEQKAPVMNELCVAFPLQNKWQRLEEISTHDKAKRFIANPPVSPVNYNDMTAIQKFAVDLGTDENHQILFICGRAGSGKTATALKICEHFQGRVQATAYTGKAASLFNGPTIHSMFAWSHYQHNSAMTEMKPDSKKVTEFRVAHEDIDLYVIEEALAIPPAYFALIDEMMTAAFNPKHKKNAQGELAPFGGKKMLFLGDQAQLPPIGGPAVYDDGRLACDGTKTRRESKQSKRTKTGQLIFEKYLVPNCIYLQRLQRNSGLLGEICDRMRQGELTEQDCTMLTYQRTRFPDACTDFGIHYQNEMCSMHNWRQLWNECKLSTPQRRMYICKATYHVTNDNSQISDALSALPPQAYDYAPNILCVAEGCEVRLLHNVNIAAGLVTSQSGTVVRVIFNNADAELLLAGDHVAPYCIIVSFAGFQGFIDRKEGTDRRIFPFPNQPTWVPVFRRRFSVKISSLPSWVRKKQLEKDCYRIQFPLDLASNITAHRAQGQTLANCLVSVDLGLENPDTKMPPEISSLLYVACTRVTKLENLFVSPIHPSVWRKIGQNDADKHRRTVDEKLRKSSTEFGAAHGKHDEIIDELACTPDSSKNGEEWRFLQQQKEPPVCNHYVSQHSTSDADFLVNIGNLEFAMFCRPLLSERHVGIDQGVKNFAIAVVEKNVGKSPNIVAAMNYTDLQLKSRFKAADVLVALTEQTDLLSWMNPTYSDNTVDRVIVHLEQIDRRNRNSKQFSVELGRLLQQQASDEAHCIVQMSSPHMHRANGPLFHLGDEIVEALQLRPTIYLQQRSRADSNPSVLNVHNSDADVEPSDDESSSDTETNHSDKCKSGIYKAKKKMSSDVFRYIMEADDEQLKQMKLTVDSNLQQHWREIIASDKLVKLDDVGDALLHALDEILCGSSNFRQLVPASPSVHVNRTIAVAVFPEITYWVVLNCRWNSFVLENFGCLHSRLRNCYYRDPSTVAVIKDNMVQCSELWSSLSEFEGNSTYDAVDHIKVVVKQLTGHKGLGMKNIEAGALTQATTNAMKLICDGQMGINSKIRDIPDRELGSLYSRTSTVHRDRKFQVVLSTGKHTNAVLSCLSWMKQNIPDFVEKRREILNEAEKTMFFHAVLNLARSGERSMEMLQLSDVARTKLRSNHLAYQMHNDKAFARNIADLVLVSMSKNQHHVKAVAANSRKVSKVPNTSATSEQTDDVEP